MAVELAVFVPPRKVFEMNKVLHVFKLIGLSILGLFIVSFKGLLAFADVILLFTKSYISNVIRFTSPVEGNSGESARWWAKHWYMSMPIRFGLLLFAPIVVFIIPVGLISIVVAAGVAVDQKLWPANDVNPAFANKSLATSPVQVKGVTLIRAATYQLEQELDSTLGWAPNDVIGTQYLDNRVSCQLGTLYATRQILTVLSQEISRLSNVDEESPLLVKARQEIAYVPDHWMFPESEDSYRASIELTRQYAKLALAGDKNANVNITTKDISSILDGIMSALAEPRGRVTGSGHKIPWYELDDRVYYASCAAAVARDVFVTLRSGFSAELEKGSGENADRAVEALDAAAKFNPWWVARGDGASMMADHRSKMSRLLTEAVNMVEVVRNSIQF